jgi:hypothetical protein
MMAIAPGPANVRGMLAYRARAGIVVATATMESAAQKPLSSEK